MAQGVRVDNEQKLQIVQLPIEDPISRLKTEKYRKIYKMLFLLRRNFPPNFFGQFLFNVFL